MINAAQLIWSTTRNLHVGCHGNPPDLAGVGPAPTRDPDPTGVMVGLGVVDVSAANDYSERDDRSSRPRVPGITGREQHSPTLSQRAARQPNLSQGLRTAGTVCRARTVVTLGDLSSGGRSYPDHGQEPKRGTARIPQTARSLSVASQSTPHRPAGTSRAERFAGVRPLPS
jgi:hypothetical protein